MVAQVFRQTVGRTVHGHKRGVLRLGRVLCIRLAFACSLYSLLHFAYAGEIFIQLAFVAGADFACKVLRTFLHAVENTDIQQAAAVIEQVVPGERGIDFHRNRRFRALPRDMRAVRHGEVRLVVTGHWLFTSENDTRLGSIFADAVGDHLIDTNAGVDDGALRNMSARQQAAGLARVDALASERLDV